MGDVAALHDDHTEAPCGEHCPHYVPPSRGPWWWPWPKYAQRAAYGKEVHVMDGDVVVWHDLYGNVRGVVKANSGGGVEFVPNE